MTDTLTARLRNLRKIYSDAIAFPDLRRERLWHSAIDGAWPSISAEIDRLTGEVKRLTLQLGRYAAGATDDMNQIVQMGMAHEEFQAKADALADLLKSALDNIQGIADDADIPSTVIREKGYAALLAYQNKEIIQGEVGKEIVENEE